MVKKSVSYCASDCFVLKLLLQKTVVQCVLIIMFKYIYFHVILCMHLGLLGTFGYILLGRVMFILIFVNAFCVIFFQQSDGG